MFFRHFLGEQAQLNVRLADFRQAPEARADLILVDAGQAQTEELSDLIDQLDERAPLALVNIVPQQAEQLLDKHPGIRGVFYSHATREHLLKGIGMLLAGGDWLPRLLMERLLGQLRRMRRLAESKATLTLRERELL
ncbi:MAG: DNA-binding response regulator, partial [Pseudomonadaceae bacterium]